MLIGTLDIGVQKFIVLNNDESENYSIFGAGITETTIGFWGYIALSVIMIVSAFKAIKEFKAIFAIVSKQILKNIEFQIEDN